MALSVRVPLKLRVPVAPLAAPVPPVATRTPWKSTSIGGVSLPAQAEDFDSVTVKVIVPAAPVMLPVPVKGMGVGQMSVAVCEEPLPETVLAPTSVPVPEPVTEPVAASLTMSSEAVPE